MSGNRHPYRNNVAAPRLRSGRLVPGLETLTRATAGNSDFAKRNAARPSPASAVSVSAEARPDLRMLVHWVTFSFMIASVARGQENNPLIGIWAVDEVSQSLACLFCSDGRYQLDTTNPDPVAGSTVTERGRYEIHGQALTLTPDDLLSAPQDKHDECQGSSDSLSLTRRDVPQSHVCQLTTGSRADGLARENVAPVLVRTWGRSMELFGKGA